MNEELIKQYTREAYRAAYGRDNPPYNVIGKFAKALLELHHTRAVAPLVEAVIRVMKWVEPIAGDNMDSKCALEENESVMLLKQALAPFQQEASQ